MNNEFKEINELNDLNKKLNSEDNQMLAEFRNIIDNKIKELYFQCNSILLNLLCYKVKNI